jgi:hypothetical protein
MPRPTVTATTERIYARGIPLFMRDADAAEPSGGGYPLLRFLSLLGDLLDHVEVLRARIDYIDLADGGVPGDTSDLVDPDTADTAWLNWLGQLVGVARGDRTAVEMRAAITNASSGWRAGSQAAVRAEVQPLLTGTKHLIIADHYTAEWTVALVTLASETAATTAAAILAAAGRTKPAGVTFVHDIGLSWAELEAHYPTWSAVEAAGSWDALVP